MKLLICFCLAACALGDRLENTYLPPSSAKTAGGSGHFLATPSFGPSSSSSGSLLRSSGSSFGAGGSGHFQATSSFGPSPSSSGSLLRSSGSSFGAGGTGHFQATSSFGPSSSSSGSSLRSSGSSFGTTGPANSYIPPAAGPVSGGYYESSSGQHNVAASRSGLSSGPQFRILKLDSNNPGDGSYNFEYETENQISQHEAGEVRSAGSAEAATVVRGSYSYTAPDGQQITVNYVADENGFRPEGAHIPTPPPIPAEIQKSLAVNAAAVSSGSSYYQDASASTGPYQGVEISAVRNAAAHSQYLPPSSRSGQQAGGYKY